MSFISHQRKYVRGFSLIEVIAVIAIITVLSAFVSTSFASLGAAALFKATSDLGDTLSQARAYAMGNRTYVYVGIAESTPAGGGDQIAACVVAAKGGTRPYSNAPGPLSATSVDLIAKLQLFGNLHMASATALTRGSMSNRPPATAMGFEDLSQLTSSVTFQWPLSGPAQYTFSKVVEFDPEGVARFQSKSTFDATVPSYIELPLLPTHGATVPTLPTDEAAIQIDGMTGVVQTYRP